MLEAFKEQLKKLLPDDEFVMIKPDRFPRCYVIIHNGKGGINLKKRFLNKMTFCNFSGSFKLSNVVARTDKNYQDDKYVELILDIVNLAWQKVLEKQVRNKQI